MIGVVSEKLLGLMRRDARARRRLRERAEEARAASRARKEAALRGGAAIAAADGRVRHARAALEVAREALAEANEALASALFEELGLDPYLDDARAAAEATLRQMGVPVPPAPRRARSQ